MNIVICDSCASEFTITVKAYLSDYEKGMCVACNKIKQVRRAEVSMSEKFVQFLVEKQNTVQNTEMNELSARQRIRQDFINAFHSFLKSQNVILKRIETDEDYPDEFEIVGDCFNIDMDDLIEE
jgi:uncharacterized protein YnzC (UPF0291/DUF896 family)